MVFHIEKAMKSHLEEQFNDSCEVINDKVTGVTLRPLQFVILDLQMPGQNGLQIVKKLRKYLYTINLENTE